MDYQKNPKKPQKFLCEKCNFVCCNKKDYRRHLLTLKHIQDDDGLEENPLTEIFNCDCGKTYKYRQGLWKHKQNCLYKKEMEEIENQILDEHSNLTDKDIIIMLLKQNNEFKELLVEQNKTIVDISKSNSNSITNNCMVNNNNSHNKTFNLQVFLNETCKDAMNLTDFVNSLQIQLSDLENVGKNGFVAGISNLIIQNLKALDITQRPVHCSDQKREVIYVKVDDVWRNDSKEGPGNFNLKKAIKQIAHKNICMIPEWKTKYPDCVFSESKKSDLYNHIMYEAMDHNESNSEKIIKRIAKEMGIDKYS